MTLRSVFIGETNNFRAGWRILMFLLLQVTLSGAIIGGLYLLVELPSGATEALGYGILLGTTFIVLRIVDHRPFHSVGLPFHPRFRIEWLQGLIIAFLMISLVFLIQYSLGYIEVEWKERSLGEIGRSFVLMVFLFLWFAFGEELLFRGYTFQTLIEGTNQYVAIFIFSVFFGLAHLGNPNVTTLGVLNTILAGVMLSVAYLKTRTLWFPTSLHAAWNFFQGYVFSFPVSGLDLEKHSLLSIRQHGPDWITGGAYGPEGGILDTIILIIGTIFILRSSSIRVGEGVWILQREASPRF